MSTTKSTQTYTGLEIAIIGMSGRFPGASSWREFWHNLVNEVESVDFLSDKELKALGVDDKTIQRKDFVKAKIAIKDKELFDYAFFDYSPAEAALLNPVHKIFHLCVWEALEDAGYNPEQTKGAIGLFAGAGDDVNWKVYATLKNTDGNVDDYTRQIITNKDYLASLISYKLNLKGPAYTVNTACSTSLVAIDQACKSLLLGDCKTALAGGVSLSTQIRKGYLFQEGMIFSADGHCRAFDKDATGTLSGEGAGVVVLKRLSDALKDGDQIYAVIKGTATNNDGNRKVGFTAPSVDGQVECIRKAHILGKTEPDTISYIETHGTGTKLGDPIEVEALNIAFNRNTKHRCAIGSVKTNIGHLDTAAGVAGLIKAALSLKYKQIPASLHFKSANPEIDFEGGPFYVNATLQEWQRKGEAPLRAGVSSLGIGGTNAHAVLEEAPVVNSGATSRRYHLLPLSARTSNSLLRYTTRLKNFIHEDVNLADMAYTLQVGRKHFNYRLPVLINSAEDLAAFNVSEDRITRESPVGKIIFMFPGQGSQYAGMGADLYKHEPVFRQHLDAGLSYIYELTNEDFRPVLFPDTDDQRINDTRYAQPLIFLLEYALSKLLLSWGLRPSFMIGHSIGEYVAAAVSGVFSFEDALRLLVHRGELMSGLPHGGMLSVGLDEESVKPYLNDNISLAAVNSSRQVVLSGDLNAIAQLEQQLAEEEVAYVRLNTSHAFHSAMQESILPAYRNLLESVVFGEIEIPFISNLTGQLVTTDVLTPEYWIRHLRETVRFADGLQTLLTTAANAVFIEVGAGRTLLPLLQKRAALSVNLMRTVKENRPDDACLLEAIGKLWANGVQVDWTAFQAAESRRRISLPTYSFEPVPYPAEVDLFAEGLLSKSDNGKTLKDWVYYPSWRRSEQPLGISVAERRFLFFTTNEDSSQALIDQLIAEGASVIKVYNGNDYAQLAADAYVLNAENPDHVKQLFSSLQSPADIIYEGNQYFGLATIIPAAAQYGTKHLTLLTNSLQQVYGNEHGNYEQSLLLGLLQVAPQEYGISCTNIDLDASPAVRQVLALLSRNRERFVALRNGHLWIKSHERNQAELNNTDSRIKEGGTYLITGGLGNAGYVLSKHLSSLFKARLILIGRQSLTPGSKTSERLAELKSAGANVTYYSADITDVAAIQALVAESGHIDGVIHAAGIIDRRYFEPLSALTRSNTHEIFAPKVQGIETLYEVFKDLHPDFVWITSSLSGVLGGLGYASYAAANLYMDHLVSARKGSFPGWISVALSGLTFTPEAAAKDNTSLSPEELVALFDWSVNLQTIPQLTIYKGDLNARVQEVYAAPKAVKPVAETQKERPALSTTYIAPETATEEKLKAIYEQFFGISGIGIEDNFFELGGDSLKGMILLKRIKNEFNVNPSLYDFLLNITIREFAAKIDELIWLKSDVEMDNEITI
jgi:acyl transferase domain-containing protein/acyl carrier protein